MEHINTQKSNLVDGEPIIDGFKMLSIKNSRKHNPRKVRDAASILGYIDLNDNQNCIFDAGLKYSGTMPPTVQEIRRNSIRSFPPINYNRCFPIIPHKGPTMNVNSRERSPLRTPSPLDTQLVGKNCAMTPIAKTHEDNEEKKNALEPAQKKTYLFKRTVNRDPRMFEIDPDDDFYTPSAVQRKFYSFMTQCALDDFKAITELQKQRQLEESHLEKASIEIPEKDEDEAAIVKRILNTPMGEDGPSPSTGAIRKIRPTQAPKEQRSIQEIYTEAWKKKNFNKAPGTPVYSNQSATTSTGDGNKDGTYGFCDLVDVGGNKPPTKSQSPAVAPLTKTDTMKLLQLLRAEHILNSRMGMAGTRNTAINNVFLSKPASDATKSGANTLPTVQDKCTDHGIAKDLDELPCCSNQIKDLKVPKTVRPAKIWRTGGRNNTYDDIVITNNTPRQSKGTKSNGNNSGVNQGEDNCNSDELTQDLNFIEDDNRIYFSDYIDQWVEMRIAEFNDK